MSFNVSSDMSIPVENIGIASASLDVDLNRDDSAGVYQLDFSLVVTEGIWPVRHKQSIPILQGITVPIPTPEDCDPDYVSEMTKQLERSKSCTISDHSLFYTNAGIVIHVVGLLLGLLECFYGYRLFKITLFLVGFGVVGVIVFVIAYNKLPNTIGSMNISDVSNPGMREFVSAGIAVACGIVGGLFTIFLFFLGIFLLGSVFGVLVFVFFVLLVHQANYFVDHTSILYAFICGCGVIGGILAIKFQRFLIILSTSCVGAFNVMSAVDYFAEQGRAMAILKSSFQSRTLQPASCWYTYMTIVIWPVLAVLGFLSQYKCTSRGYDHSAARFKRTDYILMKGTGSGGVVVNDLDEDNADSDEPLLGL